MEEYENRPARFALVFEWNFREVADFATCLNQFAQDTSNTIAIPSYLRQPSMNPQQIISVLMKEISTSSPCGDVMFAPIDLAECLRISQRMTQIEMNPFIQACMSRTQYKLYLANVYLLSEGQELRPMKNFRTSTVPYKVFF